jgi:hypothetical protein
VIDKKVLVECGENRCRDRGETLVCEIEERLYTKYWEHKFSAYAFAEAMERAVRRASRAAFLGATQSIGLSRRNDQLARFRMGAQLSYCLNGVR